MATHDPAAIAGAIVDRVATIAALIGRRYVRTAVRRRHNDYALLSEIRRHVADQLGEPNNARLGRDVAAVLRLLGVDIRQLSGHRGPAAKGLRKREQQPSSVRPHAQDAPQDLP